MTVIVSPVGNRMGMSTVSERTDVEDPSKSRSGIGGMGLVGRSCSLTKLLSAKLCIEPQSRSAIIIAERFLMSVDDKWIVKQFGSERANSLTISETESEAERMDALRRITAQLGSTQPSTCAA